MPGENPPPRRVATEATSTPSFATLGLRAPSGWVALPSERPLPAPLIPDYTVLRRIGGGAYGEVWLARNLTGSHFAIKVVHRCLFDHDRPYERELAGIRRFEPISRSHPSQVAIHHVGQNAAEGYFYYVMDLADDAAGEGRRQNDECRSAAAAKFEVRSSKSEVPLPASGFRRPPSTTTRHPNLRTPDARSETPDPASYVPKTLKHLLRTRGRLPGAECLDIALALATALEHLHGHGLIHRDIKPSNVIFVGGIPKLADIGLVTSIDATRSFVGTEGFFPPEGPGTPQADIFSLGKLIYEMATGQDRREFPELPTDLPSPEEQEALSELNAIILRACQPDPAQRYPTATALRADLERLRHGRSVKRQRARQRRWGRVRRLAVPLMLGLVAVIAVVALLRHDHRSRSAPPDNPVPAVLNPRSVFVLPILPADPNGAPADLCSRITDAFIDSLGLLTNQGLVVGPRKSGWTYVPEAEQFRRVTNQFAMRYALTGRANLLATDVSNRMGEFQEAQSPLSGARGAPSADRSATGLTSSSQPTDSFTLTLALHDLQAGQPIWTETFRGGTNEIIALERQAIAKVAGSLQIPVTAEQDRRIGQLLTNNLAALRWLREAQAAYESGAEVGYTKMMVLAQKALELDPLYLDAEFQVAYGVRCLAQDRHPAEVWHPLLKTMDAILARDDTHAGALGQCAVYRLLHEHDWDAFAELMNQARDAQTPQLIPGHDAFCYRMYGWFDRARVEQEVFENTDPTGSDARLYMATSRWAERRYEEGAQIARQTLEWLPGTGEGYLMLAENLVGNSNCVEGIEAVKKAQAIWKRQPGTALLGVAYARMGLTNQAEEVLAELHQLEQTAAGLQPYFIARVYAALSRKTEALDWLEKAEEGHSEYLYFVEASGLRTDYVWDVLQDEPRYWQMCDRLGLGKDQWPRKDIVP